MLRNQLFKQRDKLEVKSQKSKVRYTSFLIFCLCYLLFILSFKSAPTFKIAKLKYNGGGDWYANRTAIPNLINFCNENIGTAIAKDEATRPVGVAQLEVGMLHQLTHGRQDVAPPVAGTGL